MQNNHDVEPWRSRVPPGVPGAGWVIGILSAFVVIIVAQWAWHGSHSAIAAPGPSQHMSR